MGNLVDALLSRRLQTLFSTPAWFVFLFVCFSDTLALEMQDISQFYEQEGNAPNIQISAKRRVIVIIKFATLVYFMICDLVLSYEKISTMMNI